MSAEDIRSAWDAHPDDLQGAAATCHDLAGRVEPAEVAALCGLVVHVFGEHLGRFDEGLALLEGLKQRCPDPACERGIAVFHLCRGEAAEAERVLDALDGGRNATEAHVLALAAGIAGGRGRANEASRWLIRAVTLSFGLPDDHAAVRAVAVNANNLAVTLEERAATLTHDETALLRTASSMARVAWDRAGGWLEVQRAEYRLCRASLVLGEPFAAVAHAEACRAICVANAADATEQFFAHEALARACHAAGDHDGALAARDAMMTLAPVGVPAVSAILSELAELVA